MTTAVHAEVERQRRVDRTWSDHALQDVLTARLRALAGAQRALVEREEDPAAMYALRAALVDVSAAAAELAATLPAPEAWTASTKPR